MSKSEIRKKVLQTRLALSRVEVGQKSAVIMKQLMALEEYRRADILMAYLDFRNEVRTGEFIRQSLAQGKKVAVPVTDLSSKRLTPSLLFNYPDDLVPDMWGILEPAPGCLRSLEPKEIDMVLVPGVAFDEKGNRLGYGGGFYDRFLPQTRPDTFYVAPAFELQIRPQVCLCPYDCPIHCLVTEERVIYIKGKMHKGTEEI